jgi:hypothetical protein
MMSRFFEKYTKGILLMNRLSIIFLLMASGLFQVVNARETIGGYGIPYTARLVFEKSDVNKVANSNDKNLTVKSGEELLPTKQANSSLTALTVPTVKSNGWCDTAANPNTNSNDCYGWSNQSQWFLLDLSKLGSRKIWLQISAQKDDSSTDDYLVPALTVWRGQQNQGLTGDWYPNKFQGFDTKGTPDNSVSKAFWAWNLKPLNNTPGKLSWASAANNDDKTKVTLTQQVTLKGGESNYLTVILGSDNQTTLNQNANFKLLVRLSSKMPTTDPGDSNTPPPPKYDQYNCLIGAECYHPSMRHCMSVNSCEGLTGANKCLCPK